MKRRLTTLRNKRNFKTFAEYFTAIKNNDELLEEFVDRITINVSEFYRNPKRWDVLRKKVIPYLLKNKKTSQLKIWSAACSTGEEPYSLSIMLEEHFPQIRYSILATDLDEKALAQAKQGIYRLQALKDLPERKHKTHFTFKNGKYYIDERLKEHITFKQHDLLQDRYPTNFDLIVCRNVLIYFTDEAKISIYNHLSKALNKNGILFVGSTEQIFNPKEYGLHLY